MAGDVENGEFDGVESPTHQSLITDHAYQMTEGFLDEMASVCGETGWQGSGGWKKWGEAQRRGYGALWWITSILYGGCSVEVESRRYVTE